MTEQKAGSKLTKTKGGKMKTIREWLEELPEPYRSQALENFEAQKTKDRLPTRQSMYWAIYGAFHWDDTPQKHDYWSKFQATLV